MVSVTELSPSYYRVHGRICIGMAYLWVCAVLRTCYRVITAFMAASA